MTKDEYRAALARLGLSVASKATAEKLGISVRHSQHLASGKRKVMPQTERLLESLERERATSHEEDQV